MNVLTIFVQVQPHKEAEFRQAARELLNREEKPPDGRVYRSLACDIMQESLFCYTEAWESGDAMLRHFECDEFRSILGAMKVLGEIQVASVNRNGEISEFLPARE